MKILIASVSCGAGHLRAAEALETAVRTAHPSAEVVHVNVMDFVSKPFRWFYEGGYTFLAKKAPWLWGILYDISDRDLLWPLTQRFANLLQRAHAGKFYVYLNKFKPDKILATHFLAPQLVTMPLRRKEYDFSVECVVTDYGLHRFWMEPSISRYYVAHDALIHDLSRLGVEHGQVSVTGIPVDPVFVKEVNTERVRLQLGLDQIKPVVMVLSGGFGFGTLEKTVERLFEIGQPIQIIAVAGKNEPLKQRIEALSPPDGIKLITLGYSKSMHELFSISDLVITKAGGLTISEGLAKGVAMIYFGLLPGQEEKNAAYVEDRGAGVLASSLSDVLDHAKRILGSPEVLTGMK
jgi:processive 1,2-diacylglycerol beta-glucosyltransferase